MLYSNICTNTFNEPLNHAVKWNCLYEMIESLTTSWNEVYNLTEIHCTFWCSLFNSFCQFTSLWLTKIGYYFVVTFHQIVEKFVSINKKLNLWTVAGCRRVALSIPSGCIDQLKRNQLNFFYMKSPFDMD